MQDTNTTIPAPPGHTDNKLFWEGIKKHELLIQKCGECGKMVHPPLPMCSDCLSLNREWVASTGKGIVYSWVVYHEAPSPAFKTPYAVALIELEEGVRVVSSLVDIEFDEIKIGMPVQVVFDDMADDVTMPRFKKAD